MNKLQQAIWGEKTEKNGWPPLKKMSQTARKAYRAQGEESTSPSALWWRLRALQEGRVCQPRERGVHGNGVGILMPQCRGAAVKSWMRSPNKLYVQGLSCLTLSCLSLSCLSCLYLLPSSLLYLFSLYPASLLSFLSPASLSPASHSPASIYCLSLCLPLFSYGIVCYGYPALSQCCVLHL